MKIPVLLLLFGLLFVGSLSAQTVKTAEARKLEDLDLAIEKLQERIDSKKAKIKELHVKYTEEHPSIKEAKHQLELLNQEMTPLNAERVRLAKERLSTPLPNTEVELLKILIIQNERILDLLYEQRREK